MKTKLLLTIICSCALFVSCKVGTVATSGGKADIGFIELVSPSRSGNVKVTVDDTSFTGKITKEKRTSIKGTTYAVAPGKRHITIAKNGKVLYDKFIMVSAQETKKIVLP